MIYAMEAEYILDEKNSKELNEIDEVNIYYPPSLNERIIAQESRFTLHPLPEYEPLHYTVHRLLIPSELKIHLIKTLNKLGINHSTLFPDLEGISRHLKWLKNIRDF